MLHFRKTILPAEMGPAAKEAPGAEDAFAHQRGKIPGLAPEAKDLVTDHGGQTSGGQGPSGQG